MVIIDHILHWAKARIDSERLVIKEEKIKYIDEIAKQVDKS